MARKKRRSKKSSSRRSVRRNRGHRRLRRNPDTLTWILLAGGGYLAYRWWQGRHPGALPSIALPAMPSPAVVQPTPPPAISGLGTLVVV